MSSFPIKDLSSKKDVVAGSVTGGGFEHHQEDHTTPKQHHGVWSGARSTINGVGFLKSNLFIFLLGQIVMMLFWLGGFAVTYGQNSQKQTEYAVWRGQTDAAIKRMDDQGSNASYYGQKALNDRLNGEDSRLNEVEKQTKKIDVMDEKITRIDK